MAFYFIEFGEQALLSITGPLIVLNITVNIFYACCLSVSRQRIKQPLKMLLEFLVWCSIIHCVSLIAYYFVLKKDVEDLVVVVLRTIVVYYTNNSMTCYVWLNFYYYIHIVPVQHALLIWAKRNIGSVIQVAMTVDIMLFLLGSTVTAVDIAVGFNSTWTGYNNELYYTKDAFLIIIQVHFFVCLCIMMVSSFCTAHYLHRHMRSIAQSGSHLATAKIRSQVRVTISGILQGLLHIFYYTFYLMDTLTMILFTGFFFSSDVTFTVTILYLSGNTVNLGIGQAVIRQKAADILKALKALCGVGMVTKDVKLHSSQLTSSEIANPVTDVKMPM